ncbi:MAG TPA: tyrosine-type recombinase/integrase [Candidatus Tectomicrobia bacterium]
MFGKNASELTPDVYHRSPEAIGDWCDQHAPPTLGARGLANLKNNLRWLFALAVTEKWLLPIVGEIIPWRSHRRLPLIGGGVRRPRATGDMPIHQPGYRLVMPLDPDRIFTHGMKSVVVRQRANLQVVPDRLLREMQRYFSWSSREYVPDRPAHIKKRAISIERARQSICAIGGYAVHIAGMDAEPLTLATLTEPALVQAFVSWWVNERRQRITSAITHTINDLVILTEYYLKDQDHAKTLREILKALGKPGTVRDKDPFLMSLRELERVGVSLYPLNEERLQHSYFARALAAHLRDPDHIPMPPGWASNFTKSAWKAQMSLIIRLLVRLPLRQRNIREMQIGHNLIETTAGNWEIHFRGSELKIEMRRGQVVEVRYPFPAELVPQLQAWFAIWRPCLTRAKGETSTVFCTRQSKPLTTNHIGRMYTNAVYRLTGKYTTIHLIRDAWASEYLDATGDIAGAADRLGDTPQTVMKHYAHILKQRTQERTGQWLTSHLS